VHIKQKKEPHMTNIVSSDSSVVSTKAIPDSLSALRAILRAGHIRSVGEELEVFLRAVINDASVSGEFTYAALFPRDLGYGSEDNLPTRQQCCEAAMSLGFELGTPKLAFAVLRKTPPALAAGKACLIPMKPIEDSNGFMYLPQIHTTINEASRPQTMLRMVGGQLDLAHNLNTPMLFFKCIR